MFILEQKESPMLSLKEAAHRLGISYRMLWNLINRGEIKARRLGRIWRIRPEDLEAKWND